MNVKDPIATIKSPQCQYLYNFNNFEGGVRLRYGDKIALQTPFGSPVTPLRLIPYGSTELYNCYDFSGAIAFNDSAGNLVHTTTATGDDEIHYVYFNNYLFIMGEFSMKPGSAGITTYSGSVWGTAGYTGWGSKTPLGGNTYKNRAYFLGYQSASYFYTGINSISGAVTEIDLSGIIRNKSTLASIATITISDTVVSEVYQCFVFFSGEILFYSGAYPDSPTWALVGRGFIGTPLNYNSYIDLQGDALVLTDNGLYSLRDLFLKGSQSSLNLTVSRNIDSLWVSLIKAYRNDSGNLSGRLLNISGNWDVQNSRLIITFPVENFSGSLGFGNTFFIYDMLQGAWYIHKSFGPGSDNVIIDTAQYKNAIYFIASQSSAQFCVWKKEGMTPLFAGAHLDEVDIATANFAAFDYSLICATVPFPKTAVYSVCGVEPILKTDLGSTINWKLIGDFGVIESGAQTTPIQSGLSKPLINVGLNNPTFVQVKISGTTPGAGSSNPAASSMGMDLYSFNVWYDAGAIGSR